MPEATCTLSSYLTSTTETYLPACKTMLGISILYQSPMAIRTGSVQYTFQNSRFIRTSTKETILHDSSNTNFDFSDQFSLPTPATGWETYINYF